MSIKLPVDLEPEIGELLTLASETLDESEPFASAQEAGDAAVELARRVSDLFNGPEVRSDYSGPPPASHLLTVGELIEDLKRFDPGLPVGIPRKSTPGIYHGPLSVSVRRFRGQGPSPTLLWPVWAALGSEYARHVEGRGGRLVDVAVIDQTSLPYDAKFCPSNRAVMRATYPQDPEQAAAGGATDAVRK